MNVDQLEAEIAADEGLRLTVYADSVGVATIGYGTNLEAGISEAAARFMMREALIECMRDLQTFPFWHHANEARRFAMVNMRYNLGAGRFRGFRKMIEAANRGDWLTAADEAVDSRWYTQVGRRGPLVVNVIRAGEHRT